MRDVVFVEALGRRLVAVARFVAVRFVAVRFVAVRFAVRLFAVRLFAVRLFAVRFFAVCFLAAAFLATAFVPLADRFADLATGRVRVFADFAGFRFRRGGDAALDSRTASATTFGGATSSGGAGSVACQNGRG